MLTVHILPEQETAVELSLAHLASLQKADGCWEGEMVWCTMILSQYVIVRHLAGRPCDDMERRKIIRHYDTTRQSDGSRGLHPESAGYVFTTTLAYVALRLLGLDADHPLVAPARQWLHAQPGGVLAIPTWGKFWLALLDLYGYEGVNPFLPELFLLPGLPFHPRRYYCHTRYIYQAIAYLYGCRFRRSLGALTAALRQELYQVPYEQIDFAAYRNVLASSDVHIRPGPVLRMAYRLLAAYERHHLRKLRRRALDHCLERIVYEQRTSNYQGLSPVSGLLNCLALLASDPNHPDLAPSLEGLEAWKWEDEAEGRRYAGARSQTWDTAFAVQAILPAPAATASRCSEPLHRAYRFLQGAQMRTELPNFRREHRDRALGGWCFSDGQHRWPVSDCTAEALAALLAVHETPGMDWLAEERIPDERLHQAAAFILDRQNDDGGFGTYERRRGSRLLEAVNPSEMFGQCMTESSYVECTGSALAALAHFRAAYPHVLRARIDKAVARGIRFLRRSQKRDGSFAGFWGINFTYATFHAVKGLRAAGVPRSDPLFARAALWLRQAQRPDGGWGEHYSGCLQGRYVEHPQSQVVMTSWALLALLEVIDPAADAISRGVTWLRGQQHPDGSWPRQAVNGVFFGTAMLDYRLYHCYFPAWALARHASLAPPPKR